MHSNLKGVHTVKMRLASGEIRTYYYAWRGGPRINAEPDTKEFRRQFDELVDNATDRDAGTLAALIRSYRKSSGFTKLSTRTQSDYDKLLDAIGARYGRAPLRLVNRPEARAKFLGWRDSMAGNPRKADKHMTMLSILLNFGVDRRVLDRNVCAKSGLLYRANRNESIWSEEQIAELYGVAAPHVADVFTFGLWSGQRQGDILNWRWSECSATHLSRRTNKRGKYVRVRLFGPLKDLIERRRSDIQGQDAILLTSIGQPWTSAGFRASWAKTLKKTSISGLTFNDLRGTAVTRLALAGCTEAEIASITGHSLAAVSRLLEAHYLGGRAQLADQAMHKLESHYSS